MATWFQGLIPKAAQWAAGLTPKTPEGSVTEQATQALGLDTGASEGVGERVARTLGTGVKSLFQVPPEPKLGPEYAPPKEGETYEDLAEPHPSEVEFHKKFLESPAGKALTQPVIQFHEAMTPEERAKHPVAAKTLEFASGLTTPQNISLMALTGGFGSLPGFAGKIIPRGISAYFASNMLSQALQQSGEFRTQVDEYNDLIRAREGARRTAAESGRPYRATATDRELDNLEWQMKGTVTGTILSGGLAGLAGRHALSVEGGPKVIVERAPAKEGLPQLPEKGELRTITVYPEGTKEMAGAERPALPAAKELEGEFTGGHGEGKKPLPKTVLTASQGETGIHLLELHDEHGTNLGWAGISDVRHHGMPGEAQIESIQLYPGARGKGYGPAFYNQILDYVKPWASELVSDARNEASQKAWERLKTQHVVREIPYRETAKFAGEPPEEIKKHLNELRLQIPDSTRTEVGLRKGAEELAGRPLKPEKLSPDPRAPQIADAHEAMEHAPGDPAVKASYSAMKQDVAKQWDYAVQHLGVQFEPWTHEGQPYANSREMREDVLNNRHLYFFTGGDFSADHPLTEVSPKTGLAYNDMFRAIHDLFGHAVEGYQFGPGGEESAWNLHRQMFSPEAQGALVSETKAQNSWVNFGKHIREAETPPPPSQRPFAPQKAGLIPEELWTRPEREIPTLAKERPEPTPLLAGEEQPFARARLAKTEEFRNPEAIVRHVESGRPYVIMTVDNPGYKRLSEAKNAERRLEFQKKLEAEGLKAIPGKGISQDEDFTETSFFIPGMTLEQAERFGKEFGQTGGVLTREGLLLPEKNQLNAHTGGPVLTGDAAKNQPYYTTFRSPDGKEFAMSVPLDFSRTQTAQIPNLEDVQKKIVELPNASPDDVSIWITKDGRIVASPRGDHRYIGDLWDDKVSGPETGTRGEDNIRLAQRELGLVRINKIQSKAGTDINVSYMPGQTFMPEQISAIQQVVGRARYPNLRVFSLEGQVVAPRYKEMARVSDVPEILRDLAQQPRGPKLESGLLAERRGAVGAPGTTVPLLKAPLTIQGTGTEGDVILPDVANALKIWSEKGAAANALPEIERALRTASSELKYQLAQDNSGVGWYAENTDRAIKYMQELHPELKDPTKQSLFKAFWAALSYGKTPDENMFAANEAYKLYKERGEFPLTQRTGERWGHRQQGHAGNFRTLNKLLQSFKGDEEKTVDWLLSKHPLEKIHDMHFGQGASALPRTGEPEYGAMVLGPKGGAFYLNLNGVSDYLTMDMWATRTWRRWTGALIPENVDVSPTKQERTQAIKAYSQMAKDLKMEVRDVQAAMWYYEQKLYNAHGVPVEAGNYADAAKRTVEGYQGGELFRAAGVPPRSTIETRPGVRARGEAPAAERPAPGVGPGEEVVPFEVPPAEAGREPGADIELAESRRPVIPEFLYRGMSKAESKTAMQSGVTSGDWGSLEVARQYAGKDGVVIKVPVEQFEESKLSPNQKAIASPILSTHVEMRDENPKMWEKAASQDWRSSHDIAGAVTYKGIVPISKENIIGKEIEPLESRRPTNLLQEAQDLHDSLWSGQLRMNVSPIPSARQTKLLQRYHAGLTDLANRIAILGKDNPKIAQSVERAKVSLAHGFSLLEKGEDLFASSHFDIALQELHKNGLLVLSPEIEPLESRRLPTISSQEQPFVDKITETGSKYEGRMGDLYLFTDPQTGSTLALPEKEMSNVAAIQKHMDVSREEFRKGAERRAARERGEISSLDFLQSAAPESGVADVVKVDPELYLVQGEVTRQYREDAKLMTEQLDHPEFKSFMDFVRATGTKIIALPLEKELRGLALTKEWLQDMLRGRGGTLPDIARSLSKAMGTPSPQFLLPLVNSVNDTGKSVIFVDPTSIARERIIAPGEYGNEILRFLGTVQHELGHAAFGYPGEPKQFAITQQILGEVPESKRGEISKFSDLVGVSLRNKPGEVLAEGFSQYTGTTKSREWLQQNFPGVYDLVEAWMRRHPNPEIQKMIDAPPMFDFSPEMAEALTPGSIAARRAETGPTSMEMAQKFDIAREQRELATERAEALEETKKAAGAPTPERPAPLTGEQQSFRFDTDKLTRDVIATLERLKPSKLEAAGQQVLGFSEKGIDLPRAPRRLKEATTQDWKRGDAPREWKATEAGLVDKFGAPLVFYHGTSTPVTFSKFATAGVVPTEWGSELEEVPSQEGTTSHGDPMSFLGAHFAESPQIANKFATGEAGYPPGETTKPRVIPVHLQIKNPKDFGAESKLQQFLYESKHDDLLDEAISDYHIDEDSKEGKKWIRDYIINPRFRIGINITALQSISDPDQRDSIADDLASQARWKLQEQGYDGVRYENEVEGGVAWVAFEPEQIRNVFTGETAGGKATIGAMAAAAGLAGIAGLGALTAAKKKSEPVLKRPSPREVSPENIAPTKERIESWVQQYSKENKIDPRIIRAVMTAESTLRPEAVSKKGAFGLMQLMPKTAKALGVDPRNPEENVKGGTEYLSTLLRQFRGDLTKAVAAYNWGETRVRAAVSEHGEDWLEHAPQETQNHVARVQRRLGVTRASLRRDMTLTGLASKP